METKTLPKPGERIQCMGMGTDPDPIPVGARGTVLQAYLVLGEYHIDVKWDSGRTLSLVDNIDKYRVLEVAKIY